MILSVSVPVLNAIYPVAIVLIILGLLDKYIKKLKYTYKLCIYSTLLISILYAVDELFNLGFVSDILAYIPLYSQGFGWVIVCIVMFGISVLLNAILNKKKVTV